MTKSPDKELQDRIRRALYEDWVIDTKTHPFEKVSFYYSRNEHEVWILDYEKAFLAVIPVSKIQESFPLPAARIKELVS